jgi:hypothetical protein
MPSRSLKDAKQGRPQIPGNSAGTADSALGPTSESHIRRELDEGKTDPIKAPDYHEDDDIQTATQVDPLKSQLTKT